MQLCSQLSSVRVKEQIMSARIAGKHFLYKWFLCLILVIIALKFLSSRNAEDNQISRISINITNERNMNVITTPLIPYSVPHVELPKYFLHTSQCMIPYVDPFSAEVMKIYKPPKFIPCSNESDLVSAKFDTKLKRYVLNINENVARQLLNSSDMEFNCFYRVIKLGANVETYDILSPSIYFSQGYVVPLHVGGMILDCETAEKTPVKLQKDAFIFVQYDKPKLQTSRSEQKQSPRKPSVIMYGIDTISRINLRRTMPLVHQFLKGPGWYEMKGYNKVADNSFPNLLAILSGYSPEKAKEHVCDTSVKGCLDELPMIWNYFHNASYLTAFAEDESGANTFTYMKPGFTKKPTDYYFRPFLRALEEELPSYKCPGCYMKYCYGRRLANHYIYDYGRQFMQRFVAERPIWGMFWSNHFSHDDWSMPAAMEPKVLGDLLAYRSDGSLEHTIMIFFADHGARFGSLLTLSEGYLEERLPMMFIYLPPWFRAKYPKYAEALALNQHRLSSNFDLHNTLKHIIELGGTPDGPALPRSYDCPTCQSLFYPIAENRTCAQAGISEHWCTCRPYRSLGQFGWQNRIAPRIIDRMNEYFVAKNLSHLCSNLTLKYVHYTEIRTGEQVSWKDALPQIEQAVYRTKFKVNQNSADFQATVVFNNITEAVDVNVESISRTNSYKEDSTCINDKIAKLYCICFSDLKT
ncbi:PREDICTED: uncharacterized protein LOC108611897 [Drosophila arizonae]|uniref:Uncharacterized protein LOC108611897 n=1 Tax=Drosophila arizonae TaxID=7263 RepID=A0ABM1NZ40_DROAR|nr:PREDICTED: uncharacterized protein LOC108611897 [Drosophila arizonae]